MTIATDIGSLIARNPEVRGGRPTLAGTGVSVSRVVGWYRLGLSPEDIADRIGHLSLAQVHAALAYYHANREEIESDLAAQEREADALEREHARDIVNSSDAMQEGIEMAKDAEELELKALSLDAEHERIWVDEAERRYQEIQEGKVQAIPADEALARLRAALR